LIREQSQKSAGGMLMESRRYWQSYGELKKWPFDRQVAGRNSVAGQAVQGTGRDIFVHGGRAMSFEVYLTVPTFIRRGLQIAL
jgi:hypothetical protein